jgi:hypothetical protein
MLAHQELENRHGLGLPRGIEDDLSGTDLPDSDTPFEAGSSEPHLVGACKGAQMLWAPWGDRR